MKPQFLKRTRFQALINVLNDNGYDVIGPKHKQGAIVYEKLQSVAELPVGMVDEQSPGRYRLVNTESNAWFSWANGPQALKPLLFSPRENLWQATQAEQGKLEFNPLMPETKPIAIIGIKACDLAALRLQDQHFLHGAYPDAYYRARRDKLFVIAISCTHSAETCFCVSTGDGPEVKQGFDLSLIELENGFIIKSGTDQGKGILAQLITETTDDKQLQEAKQKMANAASQQTRTLPQGNLRNGLFAQFDNPRWEDIAKRCLSCGNCTSVCPTCFCHSEYDDVTLNREQVTHYRQWSSCFTNEHSYIHGIVIRAKTANRYRQWLLHKLGTWHDQYGRSGCVGCGRCIAWCPPGIDITEEVQAVCESVHD